MAKNLVDKAISDNTVMVFSKTYCPYCTMAKKSLEEVGAEFEVMELDKRGDGESIQQYLKTLTGGSTVPRVFIGGKFIGGGTETKKLQQSGKLLKLITDVGATFKSMELDKHGDGSVIQGYLATLTGGSTVPRVFVNGKFIGGGTETQALQRSGELARLINTPL